MFRSDQAYSLLFVIHGSLFGVSEVRSYVGLQAISVAERVADERCESSPGSNDSLVGYQVRLDSAR